MTFAALLLGVFVSQAFANTAHDLDACPAQTWAQMTGPNELWWKTVTACNDHPAWELQHGVVLQRLDWDTGLWSDYGNICDFHPSPPVVCPIFSSWDADSDFIADARYRNVDDYLGVLCYRMRTAHFVVEPAKGQFERRASYSTSHCY